MNDSLGLLLFSVDESYIRAAVAAGLDGVIVDLENAGKSSRQARMNTQINDLTFDDVSRIRSATDARLFCRINNLPDMRLIEVEKAIACGADEIFLPMVRSVAEVEQVLRAVDGRAELAILVETEQAVQCAPTLAQLPLSRVYVGLNDLAISRGMSNIFANISNGTVERLRDIFLHHVFGFGGLTVPPSGRPIPTELLMAEMIRLDCQFTFLRRSFLRDVPHDQLGEAIPLIRSHLREMQNEPSHRLESHHAALLTHIDAIAESQHP